MAQYLFGTGNLYLTPVGGGPPQAFGAIQDVSVSFDGDTKSLYGQNTFPLDTARGKTKITGKAAFGRVNPYLYNAAFFGQTVTTGEVIQAYNEPGATAIPGTPYELTVANSAHFVADLGVTYALTGIPLQQVVSGPTVGQYTVSAGVYTFAAADTGALVIFNYLYSSSSTGLTLTINNALMGAIPTFALTLARTYKGKSTTLQLYSCTSSKFDLPLKMDDYGITSLDFAAQDNGSGAIGQWTNTPT